MLIPSFNFGALWKLPTFDDFFLRVFQIGKYCNNTSVGVSGG